MFREEDESCGGGGCFRAFHRLESRSNISLPIVKAKEVAEAWALAFLALQVLTPWLATQSPTPLRIISAMEIGMILEKFWSGGRDSKRLPATLEDEVVI